MKLALLVGCLLVPVGLGAPDGKAAAPAGKVLTYKTSHGEAQKLEVFSPVGHKPAEAKLPVVVLFHGGGWSGGDLGQFRAVCAYLARRGIVAVTANYAMHTAAERAALPPGGQRKRICVTDAISAIRWVKGHAAELGIDPDKLVVGGSSAGGHLAMLATLDCGLADPADPPGLDTKVRGYLLFNPAFTAPGADRDDAVDVFKHLKPGMAPSLFLFGDQDTWKAASDQLVPALKKSGARAEMLVAKGQGHSFWTRQPWTDASLAAADRFLASLGLLAGDPLVSPTAEWQKSEN